MESNRRINILLVGTILGILALILRIFSFLFFLFWESKLFIIFYSLNFSFLIPAIIFNLFGWLRNDKKKILIASILYIISSSILPAVLGFIGFYKLKKQTMDFE